MDGEKPPLLFTFLMTLTPGLCCPGIVCYNNRMAFRKRMRCWCGGNVQGVCPGLILALLISVFFAIFHMEAPENTQEFFSIAFL